MGAKALSSMKAGENPEDWHIHHFRSESDCWTPHEAHRTNPFMRALPVSDLAGAHPAVKDSARTAKSEDFESPRLVTDEPGPEPEGEVKVGMNERLAGLAKQFEGYITKIESSDADITQRLMTAEAESRDLSQTNASLNSKIESIEIDRASKDKEIAVLSEIITKLESDTHALSQEKEQLTQCLATQEEHVSAEDDEVAKKKYAALQQEFDSHKMLLQTQLADCHEKLKLEAERLDAGAKEKELTQTVSTLNEKMIAIEAASASRALESAKVLELLEKRENECQNLMLQKQEANDRVRSLEAKLQECVSLEEFQAMKAQYQAVQQEFEAHKASARGQVGSLEASLQEQVSKYQSQLAVEVQRVEKVEQERTDLSNTVSSLNEQLIAMQLASAARAEESSDMMTRLDKQTQDILNLVQEKQGLVAQLAAQSSVPFEDHQSLQKLHQTQQQEYEAHKIRTTERIETLEASLTKQDENRVAEVQRFEALEKERHELTQTVSTLNAQIATLQAASTSRSIESAKVLELLAKQEQGSEEWMKEKQQLLGQLSTKESALLEAVPLEDHRRLKRQYQDLLQEFETHKDGAAKQINGLEVSLEGWHEQLRAKVEGFAVVRKERDELSTKVTELNEKIATLQNKSTSEALENATVLESLGTQYQDIYKLVQEKQKKLAKLAAQESVPFDYYQNAKKEHQSLHQEFETYKLETAEQVCSLETSLKTEVSKYEAQIGAETHRFEALERERNELADKVETLSAQVNSMQVASTSQAVESANVLERLAKQYKDIFQTVQEKQQVLAGLAAEECRMQDGDASEEYKAALDRNKNLVQELDALQDRNRTLQRDLDANKIEASQRIVKLETTIQEKEKQKRESQTKLGAEGRRLSVLEKERNELSKTVSSLSEKLSSMQKAAASSTEENKTVQDRLQKAQKAFNECQREKQAVLAKLEAQENKLHERVPLEKYQEVHAECQRLQKELESHKAGNSGNQSTNEHLAPTPQNETLQDRLERLEKLEAAIPAAVEDPLGKSTKSLGSQPSFSHTSVLESRRSSISSTGSYPAKLPTNHKVSGPHVSGPPRRSIGGHENVTIRRGRAEIPPAATPSSSSSRQSSASQRSPSAPIYRSCSNSSVGSRSSASLQGNGIPHGGSLQIPKASGTPGRPLNPPPRRGVL